MTKIDSLKKELICLALSGAFINLYYIYKEPRESLSLILAVYFAFKILNKEKNIDKDTRKIKYFALKIITLVITYFLVQILLYANMTKLDLNIEKSYIKKDKKAVLLVYQGEDRHFNLRNQTRNIYKYGTTLEKIKTSFILKEYKRSYYQIGKSDYRKNVHLVKNKLANIMDREKYDIYLGFLEDRPYIEETMKEIISSGYSEVIVVPISIKNDKYSYKVKANIDKMNLLNEEVTLKYIDGFEEGERLVNCYMKKINDEVDQKNKNSTGIILIGSGDNPTDEENLFRNKLKEYLHKLSNLEANKIKKAWFKAGSSNYISEINDLLQLGVSDIILIYAEPGVTNIENNDIYKRVNRKVSFPEGVKTKIIDGFLIEDELIEEIKEKIELEELVE